MRLLESVRRAVGRGLPIYASGETTGGSWRWWLPSAQVDYDREAGDRWDNGVVSICVGAMCRAWSEAGFVVQRRDIRAGASVWKDEPSHPLLDLLESPNSWYSGSVLWAGTLLSWMVAGNAYWLKVRGRADQVVALVYVPHVQMRPMADRDNADGRELVTYFEYTPIGGTPVPVPRSEVVHFRHGIDPRNPREGLSPLAALLREVVGDNRAATYSVALLGNMGVPGLVFSPRDAGVGAPTPEQRRDFREQVRDTFSGEGVGRALMMPFPADVTAPGLSPEQLGLSSLRDVPAARICAAFGIDPLAVHLPSDQKTFSNFGEAREAFYEEAVVGTRSELCHQVTRQLLRPDFGTDGRLWSDYSEVRVLQEDRDKLYRRVSEAYAKGVMDRATAKEALGLPVEPTDVGVYATDAASRQDAAKAVASLIDLGVSAEAAARAVGFDAEVARDLARRDWEE